jgi:hypothetical protein
MRKLPHGWQGLVWGILGFLMILSGIASGNIVTIIFGAVWGLAGTSAYLTSQVKSEHIIKKVAEVASAIMAMAIIVYGYVITRSLILGILTLFITVMFFVAFMLSYLLPRIRGRPEVPARVKDEGKQKSREFAYDVGLQLGREIGSGLEENWKSHAAAAVIAMSCGLLLISLNSVWYFAGLSTFLLYGMAYYSVSKLFRKIKREIKQK